MVRENSTPRRRRKSSEEAKTPSKNYPKGKGKADANDSRPLLQHARSEPTSRLQVSTTNPTKHNIATLRPFAMSPHVAASDRPGGTP